MQNIFPNGQGERQALEHKYNLSRNNLLLVIVFTAINLVLLVTDSSLFFLFSASIPYLLADLGMFLGGMYPAEYYTGDLAILTTVPPIIFFIMLGIAILIVLLYLISFLCSKNNKGGWLIFALVFFSLDTVGMFLYFGLSADMIIDMLFHAWVIWELASGIRAYRKLKSLPPEEEMPEGACESYPELDDTPATSEPDSPVLRIADLTEKSKELLAFEALGHSVLYLRVKKTNELVIDGNVYAEYVALIEFKHELTAILDGHIFTVGLNPKGFSYGAVDGHVLMQRVRLI